MLEDAGAWHTAELQFCFDNTKRCEQGTGDTPEAQDVGKEDGHRVGKLREDWESLASRD